MKLITHPQLNIMWHIFQRPSFKALPLISIILIIAYRRLSEAGNALPLWLAITGFAILVLLNMGVIVANYRNDKKKHGYKMVMLGVAFVVTAAILIFQYNNR